MNVYRVGIVGLTDIAAGPAPAGPAAIFGAEAPHSHAACYAALPNTRVVAVCDLVPRLLADFQAQWGGTWRDIATYTDYREMLAREKLDLLSVVTSDHAHADVVVAAAAAGVKGIFCEKPIATSLADADRMIEAVERTGVAMIVNYSRRWRPEFHQARRIIRSGELGRLSRIIGCHGGPRAMIFRNGSHMIDLINFFAESEPQWVLAELDPGHEGYGPAYAGDGGRDPATDPGATAFIRYRNGVTALYCGSKTTAVDFELDLLCQNGRIRLAPGLAEVQTPGATTAAPLLVKRLPWPQYVRSDGVAAITELVGLVEHGGEGQCPPREARKTIEIIMAVLRSQHQDCIRVDLPLATNVQAMAG